jgi:hypothetical protein
MLQARRGEYATTALIPLHFITPLFYTQTLSVWEVYPRFYEALSQHLHGLERGFLTSSVMSIHASSNAHVERVPLVHVPYI